MIDINADYVKTFKSLNLLQGDPLRKNYVFAWIGYYRYLLLLLLQNLLQLQDLLLLQQSLL